MLSSSYIVRVVIRSFLPYNVLLLRSARRGGMCEGQTGKAGRVLYGGAACHGDSAVRDQ